jgi:hypothetical protein
MHEEDLPSLIAIAANRSKAQRTTRARFGGHGDRENLGHGASPTAVGFSTSLQQQVNRNNIGESYTCSVQRSARSLVKYRKIKK